MGAHMSRPSEAMTEQISGPDGLAARLTRAHEDAAAEPACSDHTLQVEDLRRRIETAAGVGKPECNTADPSEAEHIARWMAADSEETARILVREVLAKVAGLVPVAEFRGGLPSPVLWMDSKYGGGTVLRAGDVALLSGAGGVGKSFVTLALAVAAAGARTKRANEACGLHVRSGPVVMLSYEDDPRTLAFRAGLIAAGSGPKPDPAPPGLFLVRDPEPLMKANPDRPGEAEEAEHWHTFFTGVRALAPSLVVVDPASAVLAGVNQNDGTSVRRFIRALALQAEAGGFGILVVAHSTKAARYNPNLDPSAGAVAGSGQWWDAARGVLRMRGLGPNKTVLECVKANHGPTGWAVTLEADMRPDEPSAEFAGWKRGNSYSPKEWAERRKRDKSKRAPSVKAESNGAAPTNPNDRLV